jgi:phage-related protein (TIGR01555 family)
MNIRQRSSPGWLTFDSLFNLISGFGTSKDPTTAMQMRLNLLDRSTLEQMYRADWISRKIVDAPAEDATREWREWTGSQKQIEAIEEAEKAQKLQLKMKMAIVRARLYGGAAIVFAVRGQDPATDLDLESVGQGDLEWTVVMNRYELMAGPRLMTLDHQWYSKPEYYRGNAGLRHEYVEGSKNADKTNMPMEGRRFIRVAWWSLSA